MSSNERNVSILLGITGYNIETFKFHFCNLLLKKDSFNNSILTNIFFNSFKPLIYNEELVSERMNNYYKGLKNEKRLEYLDFYDCRPSYLLENLINNYDFENKNEAIELFDNPLFRDLIIIPDSDTGYFEILFEEEGRTLNIPDLDELFISSDLFNIISNIRTNMNISSLNTFNDFLEISNEYFEKLNDLIHKNETYLEEYCYFVLRNWLLDNSENIKALNL